MSPKLCLDITQRETFMFFSDHIWNCVLDTLARLVQDGSQHKTNRRDGEQNTEMAELYSSGVEPISSLDPRNLRRVSLERTMNFYMCHHPGRSLFAPGMKHP